MARDGGQVFPTTRLERNPDYDDAVPSSPYLMPVTYSGLSLRDYFAGQALIGLLGCPQWVRGVDAAAGPGEFKAYVAAHAYAMADAMLKARETERG